MYNVKKISKSEISFRKEYPSLEAQTSPFIRHVRQLLPFRYTPQWGSSGREYAKPDLQSSPGFLKLFSGRAADYIVLFYFRTKLVMARRKKQVSRTHKLHRRYPWGWGGAQVRTCSHGNNRIIKEKPRPHWLRR